MEEFRYAPKETQFGRVEVDEVVVDVDVVVVVVDVDDDVDVVVLEVVVEVVVADVVDVEVVVDVGATQNPLEHTPVKLRLLHKVPSGIAGG